MKFEPDTTAQEWGERFGFVFSYLIFTTALYLIFLATRRMPLGGTYWYFALITLAITLLGMGLKRWLK